MPLTTAQRNEIITIAKSMGIICNSSVPQTITSSIVTKTNVLLIKVTDLTQLPRLLKKLHKMKLTASVIGGGRDGNNNSYSIGKLWQGTDVFIQLAGEPTVNILKEKEKLAGSCARISPNIMLTELNRKLYAAGYHCPTLCGCLPFMSFAGGLSTHSHTSFGYLADVVTGIEVLLPNGKMKYFKKGDKDFDLFVGKPSLGLLGVITAIDIRVEHGRKKLQRSIVLSTYSDFMTKIHTKKEPFPAASVIFSPVNLNNDTVVKVTTWKWVTADAPDQGTVIPQIVDNSFRATRIAPWLAQKTPALFSNIFNKPTMSASIEGTVIAPAETIMGPEAILTGKVTEMGLFFNYDEKKLNDFLQRLMELLENKQRQNQFPINTAVFIRFPKNIGQKTHRVAVDFASLGVNLQNLQPFVNEVASYLNSTGVAVSLHYGKSDAISSNRLYDQSINSGWEKLKEKYQAFYKKYHLDKAVLRQRIHSLEQTSQVVPVKHEDEEAICQKYLNYCENYQKYLGKKMDKLLQTLYSNVANHYYMLALKPDYCDTIIADKTKTNAPKPISGDITEEWQKAIKDHAVLKILKKYEIINSLKKQLKTKSAVPSIRIEAFHRTIDQQRKLLTAQREPALLKWLGVFVAGCLGLGVFSYWTVKASYNAFFATQAKKQLLDSVEIIRTKKYQCTR